MRKYAFFASVWVAACACPPPATPEPPEPAVHGHHDKHEKHDMHGKHGQHEKHDMHGKHGHHGKHDDPLVHGFTEGPEHWRKKFEEPGRDASQRPTKVVEAMGLTTGMSVADVGAGTGYFLQYLSPAVGDSGQVLAVDIEPTMVRYLKQRASEQGNKNVSARLALMDDPLLGDASMDRILIVNTWHHIPKREAYASKLRGALKPGGEVWIIDFNMKTERGPSKEHRLPPATIIAELKSAGLQTRLDEALLPDQYIAVGKRPSS